MHSCTTLSPSMGWGRGGVGWGWGLWWGGGFVGDGGGVGVVVYGGSRWTAALVGGLRLGGH